MSVINRKGWNRMSEPVPEGKSHVIPRQVVWDAWLKVKRNGGAAGADGVTIGQFEGRLKDNLYKLWNRMSSGLFPGAGPRGGDPQEGRNESPGYSEYRGQGGADGGGHGAGAECGEGIPRGLLRVSSRLVTPGCGGGVQEAVLGEELGCAGINRPGEGTWKRPASKE